MAANRFIASPIIMKKITSWSFLIVIVWGIIESISYGGLYLLEKYKDITYKPIDILSSRHVKIINYLLEDKPAYRIHSSRLGWTTKSNGSTDLYQSNSSAIRSNREYAPTPAENILRISTYGDSFTHGSDVGNHHTWQAFMENFKKNIEVLNFGVGGYGVDQAYLRYLEKGKQFKSHFVFIGFMTDNNYRHVNTFRPFLNSHTGTPLSKPRYIIRDGKPVLLPNQLQSMNDYKALLRDPRKLLSRLGVNDYYYQHSYRSGRLDWAPSVRIAKILWKEFSNSLYMEKDDGNRYDEKSEAFRLTCNLFDKFHEQVIKENSIPIILIFPNKEDMRAQKKYNFKRYSPLITFLESKGYKYIDLMDAFDEAIKFYELSYLFHPSHYSPLSNKLVAEHILRYMEENKLNTIGK